MDTLYRALGEFMFFGAALFAVLFGIGFTLVDAL